MADISKIKLGSTNYNVKDTSARNSITSITNNLTTINNRLITGGIGNALFIGDSYSDTATGYTKALPELIKDILHIDVIYNYAIAGSGYVNGSGTNQHFAGQLASANSALSTAEKNNVSYVFFLGGQNDAGHTTSNLITQLSSIFDNAKVYFPNAKIVVLPLWYNKAPTPANVIRFTLIYYYALLKGCLTDTLSWAYLINNSITMMIDGVHPSQASLGYLAACVCNVINGNNAVLPQSGGIANRVTESGCTYVNPNITFSNGVVQFRGMIITPATGLGTSDPIFHITEPFWPNSEGNRQLYGYRLGNTPVQFTINPDGDIVSNIALGASQSIFIDGSWNLFNSVIS